MTPDFGSTSATQAAAQRNTLISPSRTSHSKVTPQWLRALMPSMGDLIFLALLGALASGGLQQRLLGDAGTGWHIRNGEHILQTHAIPRQDYFSYTKTGQPWFAWE